jgi:tetratricopeptide (TPR) repeat protein
MMNIDRRNLERVLFKLTMWLIVFCSIIAIATKAMFHRPGAVPAHYLLIIAMVAAFLSIIVPNLESYILSRVSEISVGGFKLVVAQAATIQELLKVERLTPNKNVERAPSDHPFPVAELKGFQLYEYEKFSHKLYHVVDQIKEPNDLSPDLRENYRGLLKHVGDAAFAMKHYTKYLEIVLHLKQFTDRELSAHELYLIGHAYLWAADEQPVLDQQRDYWQQSVPFLSAAMKANPYEVKYPFNLGVGLLSLGKYDKAIELMQTCINMDSELMLPWATWNIACGLKRQGNNNEVLEKLRGIPIGLWWPGIAKDDWFKDSKNPEFENSFKALCEEKIAAFKKENPALN